MIPSVDHELRQRVIVVLSATMGVVVGLALGVSIFPFRRAELPTPAPIEIEAGLIELPSSEPILRPAPLAPPQAKPPEPVPVRKPEALPLPKPVERRLLRHTEAPASSESSPPVTSSSSAPHAEAPLPAKVEDGLSGGTGGARAIYQPAPVIPPELRRHVMDLTAMVRFTIGPDGSATAELEEATPDLRLNQMLMDTFRRWRFFPATEHGRPVSSTMTLRVPLRVE